MTSTGNPKAVQKSISRMTGIPYSMAFFWFPDSPEIIAVDEQLDGLRDPWVDLHPGLTGERLGHRTIELLAVDRVAAVAGEGDYLAHPLMIAGRRRHGTCGAAQQLVRRCQVQPDPKMGPRPISLLPTAAHVGPNDGDEAIGPAPLHYLAVARGIWPWDVSTCPSGNLYRDGIRVVLVVGFPDQSRVDDIVVAFRPATDHSLDGGSVVRLADDVRVAGPWIRRLYPSGKVSDLRSSRCRSCGVGGVLPNSRRRNPMTRPRLVPNPPTDAGVIQPALLQSERVTLRLGPTRHADEFVERDRAHPEQVLRGGLARQPRTTLASASHSSNGPTSRAQCRTCSQTACKRRSGLPARGRMPCGP